VWRLGKWGREQISGFAPVTTTLFNCSFSMEILILLYTGRPIKQMDTDQTGIYDRCYVLLKSLNFPLALSGREELLVQHTEIKVYILS
jgi:hypothetical protein